MKFTVCDLGITRQVSLEELFRRQDIDYDTHCKIELMVWGKGYVDMKKQILKGIV